MATLKRLLTSLRRNDRGSALVLTAILLPLVFGGAGLAVDSTVWVLTKRQMQHAADAAAIAGSYAAVQGSDVDVAVGQALSPTKAKISKLSAQTTMSPEDRFGDPYAVGVSLSASNSLPFSSMFLSRPVTISASATATMMEVGDFCAFGLGSSAETGIKLQPNTTVRAECSFATNSSSSSAVSGHQSSILTIRSLLAYGGIEGGAAMTGSAVRSYALKQNDPFAGLDPP